MATREDDFLARWSRRKVEARTGLRRRQENEPRPPEPEVRPARSDRAPEHSAKLTDPAPADPAASFDADLRREEETTVAAVNRTPAARDDEFESLTEEQRAAFADVDFDKLTPDDDFSRFMREDVPEVIRRRALRALWSHPILSHVDRLNDYDDDFTDAALAMKIVSSNYKPGSGYLTDEERARYSMDDADAEEIPDTGESDATEAEMTEAEDAGGEDDGERKEAGDPAEREIAATHASEAEAAEPDMNEKG